MLQLTQPLYHGTGSFFLPEIERYGLGGRNIPHLWRTAELLEEVWSACRASLPCDDLTVWKEWVGRMLANWDKRESDTPSNWRAGGLYLTSSYSRARSYARNAGPEHVATTLELLGMLQVAGAPAEDIVLRYPEVAAWRAADSRPIIFEVTRLDPALLRTECGGDATEELRVLEAQQALPEMLRADEQFEYVGSLPANCISWSFVD